jgi:predicted RNase H-like nuclease (RuvC/YqgF family)
MPQEMVHVGARIPKELFNRCKTKTGNITSAIIDGLNLLCETDCKTKENNCKTSLEELETQIEERDIKINELQNINDSLIKEIENHKEPEILQIQNIRIQELQDQLKAKDDQIKVNDGHQNNRIGDLKNNIYLLDNQLRTKDDQIEKLNENMHKQAVHIQSLIQENSKLNSKLLPENVEKKKPWWQFW